jgi:hypothetical protein
MLKSNVTIISGQLNSSTKVTKAQTKKGEKSVSRAYITHQDFNGKHHNFIVEAWGEKAEKLSEIPINSMILLKGRLLYEKTDEGSSVYINASEIYGLKEYISLNTCVLSGNLTCEPELKSVQIKGSDSTVARLSVAFNDFLGKPHYLAIESWASLANTTKSLIKGATIETRGRLIQKTWGENKSQVLISASEIDFVSKPKNLK